MTALLNYILFLFILSNNHDYSGIIGCLGGLYYNNQSHMLSELVMDGSVKNLIQVLEMWQNAHWMYVFLCCSMAGVQAKCVSACDNKPCTNGAQCIEKWQDYSCHCANPYSQSGHECQNGNPKLHPVNILNCLI